MAEIATKYITGQNQYSASVALAAGQFNFSVTGSFVATVTVQRSFDAGVTWFDVGTFTSAGEYSGEEIESGVHYRFGVKTGEFTSGAIIGRLGQ